MFMKYSWTSYIYRTYTSCNIHPSFTITCWLCWLCAHLSDAEWHGRATHRSHLTDCYWNHPLDFHGVPKLSGVMVLRHDQCLCDLVPTPIFLPPSNEFSWLSNRFLQIQTTWLRACFQQGILESPHNPYLIVLAITFPAWCQVSQTTWLTFYLRFLDPSQL